MTIDGRGQRGRGVRAARLFLLMVFGLLRIVFPISPNAANFRLQAGRQAGCRRVRKTRKVAPCMASGGEAGRNAITLILFLNWEHDSELFSQFAKTFARKGILPACPPGGKRGKGFSILQPAWYPPATRLQLFIATKIKRCLLENTLSYRAADNTPAIARNTARSRSPSARYRSSISRSSSASASLGAGAGSGGKSANWGINAQPFPAGSQV